MSQAANVEEVDRIMAAATNASGAGGSNDHQVAEPHRSVCNSLRTRSAPTHFAHFAHFAHSFARRHTCTDPQYFVGLHFCGLSV
jgi:hypothetical protein